MMDAARTSMTPQPRAARPRARGGPRTARLRTPGAPRTAERIGARARLAAGTLAVLALLLAAGAQAASATTFCIQNAGCVSHGGTSEADLPHAVQDAQAAHAAGAARNRIEIGAGTIPFAGEADDLVGNPITIVGAGRGKTILEDKASGGFTARVLGITEPSSTVSDLTVRLTSPAGNPTTFSLGGLLLRDGASADRVDIDGTQSGASSLGLDIRGSSSFANGTISMPKPSGAPAVGFVEGGGDTAIQVLPGGQPGATATISQSTLTGVTGLDVTGGGAARASQMTITAIGAGALTDGGELDLYDSLVRTASVSNLPASRPPSNPASGLIAVSTGANATLRADNVTVVGDGTGFGMLAGGGGGGGSGQLIARNVVVSRYDVALLADAGHPGTRLDVDHSAFSQSKLIRNAAFALGPHNLNIADPGFADSARGNFALSGCSPLVDRGDPAPLSSGEPKVDLAGNPRVLAGSAGGRPIRDIGALEFKPPRGGSGCPAHARVSFSSHRARLSHGVATIRIGCPRHARIRCAGTLTLSVRIRVGRHGTRTVTLGRGRYTMAQGRPAAVHVRLSGLGRRLVAHARHHTLRVTMSAAQAGPRDPSSAARTTLLLSG